MLALKSPELDLRALTVVNGNCTAAQGTLNARKILQAAGRCDVTVATGAARPLLREPLSGWIGHGPDGLGGFDLPLCERQSHPLNAVRFLIETLLSAPEPLTLLPIAPLTNIALALAAAPEIASRIKELIIMGGAVFSAGNRSPAAEFNIVADPEAARMVFAAGVPITLVGLDVTEQVALREEHVRRLEAANNPQAAFVARCARYVMPHSLARYGDSLMHLHDPLAVGVAFDRSLVRTRKLAVDVETETGISLGKTLADPWGRWGKAPNVEVCVEVDAERFIGMMLERLCGA
ncbi:MAG: nucleoside hydrolase [Chloroflexi bacterium]|nr:nucleoside hydrolase [Chloroflexota bacterium]